MKTTWNDGIDDAIHMLRSYSFARMGDCTARVLFPVNGATTLTQLYIDEIEKARQDTGTYAEGILHAVSILERYGARRTDKGPGLVPVEQPDQHMSLYVSHLMAGIV
jgi:hypothetical protein